MISIAKKNTNRGQSFLDVCGDFPLSHEGHERDGAGKHDEQQLADPPAATRAQVQRGHQIDGVREPVDHADDHCQTRVTPEVLERHTNNDEDHEQNTRDVSHHAVAGQGRFHVRTLSGRRRRTDQRPDRCPDRCPDQCLKSSDP